MTIYQIELTLPVNGSLDNQTSIELNPNAGVLDDFYVLFPGGHAGLTHVRVLQAGSQVIPFNNLSYLTGDSVLYRFRPDTRIMGRGVPLIFSGYSDDDTYPHTVFFSFDIKAQNKNPVSSLRERLGL